MNEELNFHLNVGFKKDQLKVQMDNLGNLRISGERSLADQRWSRFRKDFRIPQNTITSEVRAKFQNENLYVIVPKPIAKSQPQDRPKAQEPESGKKTTMEPKSRENQNRMSQKDSPLSSSKPNDTTMTQSNGKSRKTGETDTTKTAPTVQEKEKDQIHKPEDKQQPANDTGNKNAELPSSRKRKTVVEDEKLHHGGSEMERKVGGLGMRFKKPRQIMLNVGVAAVIFVGLAFYVSYKVRKSIEADNN